LRHAGIVDHYGRAVPGAEQCDFATDATARTRYRDDLAFQDSGQRFSPVGSMPKLTVQADKFNIGNCFSSS
jgi:hypothetical protein